MCLLFPTGAENRAVAFFSPNHSTRVQSASCDQSILADNIEEHVNRFDHPQIVFIGLFCLDSSRYLNSLELSFTLFDESEKCLTAVSTRTSATVPLRLNFDVVA